MYFNSYIFILAFLPSVLVLYFGANYIGKSGLGKYILLLGSIIYYLWFDIKMILVALLSISLNYIAGALISKKDRYGRFYLFAGVSLNIVILGYFKYSNFFINSLNRFFAEDYPLIQAIVPVGISFFTFQQVAYLVDCYKAEIKYGFIDYFLHVLFFVYIISGPIVRHNQIIPQFNALGRKKFDYNNFSRGIFVFSLGLGKKVLIADVLAKAVNIGYGNMDILNSASAIVVMLAYTFQIYFDFSGYSDMALGIGLMFNFDISANFNSPYKAASIGEFWERWHITLTRFLTEYVYIPLGGNRKGKIRTFVNIFAVFLVSGIWHGASWTFVIWGILHGVFSVAERIFRKAYMRIHVIYAG